MIDSLLARLAEIAETEFADLVITCEINEGKLRLYINDENVSESSLPEAPDDALRYTLIFVRNFLHKNEIDFAMRENKSAL